MRPLIFVALAGWLATISGCGQQSPVPASAPAGGASSGKAQAPVDSTVKNVAPILEEQSPLIGKAAPDIEQGLLDGSHFSLKEQQDKAVVILDFWATWCGPCVMEMPIIAKVADKYRDKGVALYCVNQQEDADTIRSFLKDQDFNVTVSLDSHGDAGSAYGADGIPMLVVIDKAGMVRSVHVGYSPDIGKTLEQELDVILAGTIPPANGDHAPKTDKPN